MPTIRFHAHGVPLASPGTLTFNDRFLAVDLDDLDPETGKALASYIKRGLVAPHPDDAAELAHLMGGPPPPPRPESAANMRARHDELAQTNAELEAINQALGDDLNEVNANYQAALTRIQELEAAAAAARDAAIAASASGTAETETPADPATTTTKEERPSRKR